MRAILERSSCSASLDAAGSVEDFGESERNSLAAAFASAAGVSAERVTVSIASASVIVTARIRTADASESASVGGHVEEGGPALEQSTWGGGPGRFLGPLVAQHRGARC